MIHLKSYHLQIDSSIVERIFKNEIQTFIVYQTHKNTLLLSPVSNSWFKNIHKNAAQRLMKTRNIKGDKTVDLKEIFDELEIDNIDGELNYEIVEKTQLLKIRL